MQFYSKVYTFKGKIYPSVKKLCRENNLKTVTVDHAFRRYKKANPDYKILRAEMRAGVVEMHRSYQIIFKVGDVETVIKEVGAK